MAKKLSKANQALAEQKASWILNIATNAEDAIQRANDRAMWTLENSRSDTDYRIASEVERIVRAQAATFFNREAR